MTAKITAPTENKILSIANGLAKGADPREVAEDLIAQGFTPYGAFLTVKAAEVYNRMSEKELPGEG